MIRSDGVAINASVGQGGVNRQHDVKSVQALINEHLPTGISRLSVDGIAGPLTIGAIRHCQEQFGAMKHPDGRIDAHGHTLRVLNAIEAAPHPISPPRAHRAAPPTPHPATPPKSATPADGFPANVIAAAQTAQGKTSIPAAITLAQWAIESGYGKHMPTGSNNPFGIKAAQGQPYVEARTREVIGGKSVYINARFRKFDSLDDAFAKHGELLAHGRPYAHARTLLKEPDKFADALTGVYATDPNYGTLLKSVMKGANLYQYD